MIIINIVFFHSFERIEQNAFEYEQDPVNSLAEFVIEVCFDTQDHHPGDERQAESSSDTSKIFTSAFKNLQLIRMDALLCDQLCSQHYDLSISQTWLDINNPPPEITTS